jgi:hypothetical protein
MHNIGAGDSMAAARQRPAPTERFIHPIVVKTSSAPAASTARFASAPSPERGERGKSGSGRLYR